MTSWAKVGAKVVCVDASRTDKLGLENVLNEGAVYDVEWSGYYKGVASVRLVGVQRDMAVATGDPYHPFKLSRFRPIVTKTQEQDVEMFKSILTKSPEPV